MISIILMEPEHPGNIGAIARTLGNFGLTSLYLVNPKVDHLDSVAIARSKHAKDILKNAKVITKEELKKFDLLVATSAKKCSEYNINRSPLKPQQLSEQIHNRDDHIGLLLGREGNGLNNEEIAMCDFIVTIPTASEYTALNLSHACSILCYEIFKSSHTIEKKITMPTREEKDVVVSKIKDIIEDLPFSTEDKKSTQMKFWKRLISKAFLTKRELYVLFGFIKKVNQVSKK